jgi:hypothetical protein
LERILLGRTACLIGTGPSLTKEQIETAQRKGFALCGVNNTWKLAPLAVLYACNYQWWKHYWCDELALYPAQKWTTNRDAAREFWLNYIAETNRPGLSTSPDIVHHGHGSGYTLLNLAYLMGAERIVLLGYDLKYAPDYDGKARQIGSSQRHYFGEYPAALQHWPSVYVRDGRHIELLGLYRSVAAQGAVEIINCSPDSALDCFPVAIIDAV